MATKKHERNTERQATDHTDKHGLICLRQRGLATKTHEGTRKNTKRHLVGAVDYRLPTTNYRLVFRGLPFCIFRGLSCVFVAKT